ncbi:MAG: NAD(P)/FAD-dependent oxidoreductase [Deltaproteobacteria bacterium]|nr:NAD(P)/FAD-dependent oxidoreductase [Deltaproteobacteria bacterium]
MENGCFVILGNGGAAIFASEAIRSAGYAGELHIVSDAITPAFNPMLSPYYLKGVIPWEGCFPFGSRFYDRHDITCHFDAPAEFLDMTNQRVNLVNGKQISYDRCLIATGASPVMPPVPGLRESSRAYPLRSAESVKNLQKAMRSAKKVIVLGASLVGLKVAEVMSKNAIKVIVMDIASQLLPNGASPSSAEFIRTYFEEHGVDFRLGCSIEGMEDLPDGGIMCHFSDNTREKADFMAVCTGVRPNLNFIEPDGIEMKQAVLVDERMKTNRENLYAAGDVSQGYNLITGKQEWLGTWGNACCQGRVAGYNMAGKDGTYQGSIPQNISPFFSWAYAQLGDVQRCGEFVSHIAFGDPGNGGYCLLCFEKDVLIGANLINCTDLAGKIRTIITLKRPWGNFIRDAEVLSEKIGFEKILYKIFNKEWRP